MGIFYTENADFAIRKKKGLIVYYFKNLICGSFFSNIPTAECVETLGETLKNCIAGIRACGECHGNT